MSRDPAVALLRDGLSSAAALVVTVPGAARVATGAQCLVGLFPPAGVLLQAPGSLVFCRSAAGAGSPGSDDVSSPHAEKPSPPAAPSAP